MQEVAQHHETEQPGPAMLATSALSFVDLAAS